VSPEPSGYFRLVGALPQQEQPDHPQYFEPPDPPSDVQLQAMMTTMSGSSAGMSTTDADSGASDMPASAPHEVASGTQERISRRTVIAANDDVKAAKAWPRARSKVGRAVLKNAAEIELIGASFIALIDSRIEELEQKRPNSDEAKAAVDTEIADYKDLRAQGSGFPWRNRSIFDREGRARSTWRFVIKHSEWAYLGWCGYLPSCGRWRYTSSALSVAIPGTLVGGKHVVEAIKDCTRQTGRRPAGSKKKGPA
jgi:hypothetical protein